jgi:hypothetical protein
MKKWAFFVLGGLVGSAVVLIVGTMLINRGTRPPAAPPDMELPPPWGAIDVAELDNLAENSLEEAMQKSFEEESEREFDADGDGVRTYSLLALSGGGSQGAFGAGLLCGWSESGMRPDFKVVTGVSTGSLQAPFAFLGPEYDDELKEIFTAYETRDIRTRRPGAVAIVADGVFDSEPLKALIARYADQALLDAVAEKHRAGHRLYVGTTNMDTGRFVIWDMGEIAKSGRPDAVARFNEVLLASCSVPALFPPVYLGVESGGETYYEMHTDGAAYQSVFFRGFLIDFEEAIEDAALGNWQAELFIIRNGALGEKRPRRNVSPRAVAVAARTIENSFELAMSTSSYRIYVLARRFGVDFNFAALPDDERYAIDPTEFDRPRMQELFDLGFERARDGYDWLKQPPELDSFEVIPNREPAND